MNLTRPLGKLLASYLSKPIKGYLPPATSSLESLRGAIAPGDVLLVEGDTRVSTAIKYLTQSTWSHAALYIGSRLGRTDERGELLELIEADLLHGVHAVPLSRYGGFHTRLCRPVGLSEEEIQGVLDFAIERLGGTYDLANLIDLVRYLLPIPPVPTRYRRRMLELGSGQPTQAICSTLIAQAFQSVRYPILPHVEQRPALGQSSRFLQEVLRRRHHSLFTPRDFDISPYFEIVKPRLEAGFDPKTLRWADDEVAAADRAPK
jgi:hypothetical protein